MRTRNDLERLTAAGRPILADTESLVDGAEQERILDRILASDRPAFRSRRPLAIALAAAVVIGGAVAAVVTHGNAVPQAKTAAGHHHIALTGARIQAAGYHFKTPAGFAPSRTSCVAAQSSSGPVTVMNGFAAAASADGGCVEASFLISNDGTTPGGDGATPVNVGSYQGYYVSQDASGESYLYVGLPKASGDGRLVYLQLAAENLSESQLIAVAQSGLPEPS